MTATLSVQADTTIYSAAIRFYHSFAGWYWYASVNGIDALESAARYPTLAEAMADAEAMVSSLEDGEK